MAAPGERADGLVFLQIINGGGGVLAGQRQAGGQGQRPTEESAEVFWDYA
jgi:hypothetical protein